MSTPPPSRQWGRSCRITTTVVHISHLLLYWPLLSTDKKILGLGFGSQVGGEIRHCFPLNEDPRNPYCRGVEGLLQNYINTLNTVTLAEPTVYSEVLEFAANDALRAGSETEYTVILLITDGGISDLEQTKKVLVGLSSLPISVVLVGVGKGDMRQLVQLDSDKARLSSGDRQAVRDIVQFVGQFSPLTPLIAHSLVVFCLQKQKKHYTHTITYFWPNRFYHTHQYYI